MVRDRAENAFLGYIQQMRTWAAFPPPRAGNVFEPPTQPKPVQSYHDLDYFDCVAEESARPYTKEIDIDDLEYVYVAEEMEE